MVQRRGQPEPVDENDTQSCTNLTSIQGHCLVFCGSSSWEHESALRFIACTFAGDPKLFHSVDTISQGKMPFIWCPAGYDEDFQQPTLSMLL